MEEELKVEIAHRLGGSRRERRVERQNDIGRCYSLITVNHPPIHSCLIFVMGE